MLQILHLELAQGDDADKKYFKAEEGLLPYVIKIQDNTTVTVLGTYGSNEGEEDIPNDEPKRVNFRTISHVEGKISKFFFFNYIICLLLRYWIN